MGYLGKLPSYIRDEARSPTSDRKLNSLNEWVNSLSSHLDTRQREGNIGCMKRYVEMNREEDINIEWDISLVSWREGKCDVKTVSIEMGF